MFIEQANVSAAEFLRRNFIRLTVIMTDPTPTLVKDVATQSLVGVLAQWCGALGFWMGLSSMTVFELIQLLFAVLSKRQSRRSIIAAAESPPPITVIFIRLGCNRDSSGNPFYRPQRFSKPLGSKKIEAYSPVPFAKTAVAIKLNVPFY